MLAARAHRFVSVARGCHHVEPRVGEVARHGVPPHRVVVDHHDLDGVDAAHGVTLGAKGRGRISSTSVPCPGVDVMSARPPRSRRRPADRLVDAEASGSRAACSRPGAMPDPSSRTRHGDLSVIDVEQHPCGRIRSDMSLDVVEGCFDSREQLRRCRVD